MVDVQPVKGLYYPHHDFGSAAWVKSALLYWEGIVRPRHPLVAASWDGEFRELAEAGLIEDVSIEGFAPSWLPLYGERVEDLLRTHHGRLPTCIPRLRVFRGTPPEVEAQIRDELAQGLEARGYRHAAHAMNTLPDESRGMGVTVMATEFKSATVTRDSKTVTQVDGHAIAQLCIPTPSLEAISELPVARLIEIRDKYAAQRRHFRETVQARATAIANLPSPEAIRDHLETLREEIREDLEGAREAVKDAKIKDRWSLLAVIAPASLTAGVTITQAASPVLGPLGGAGALALSVTSWFMQRRSGHAHGSHYLLSLDEAVARSGRSLAGALPKLVMG
jgi:hypothetical protein